MRNNLDLSITLLRDGHGVAEVSNASVNLDLILEEFLEGRDVEDLVAGGLGGVDDELLGDLGRLAFGGSCSVWCHCRCGRGCRKEMSILRTNLGGSGW